MRLRVTGKQGTLGLPPYLLRANSSPSTHIDQHTPTSRVKSDHSDEQGPGFPSLSFYALQSLFIELESPNFPSSNSSQSESETYTLTDIADLPRLSFPLTPSLIQELYPKHTLVNTSPLRWAVLCRLFEDIPDEIQTFYLPLSDPYVIPFQHPTRGALARGEDGIGDVLTTVSLGQLGTDGSISTLAKLNNLVGLDLSYSRVSNVGISLLAWSVRSDPAKEAGGAGGGGPARLKVLVLAKTSVNENIERDLEKFRYLQYFDLRGTRYKKSASSLLSRQYRDSIPQAIMDLDLLTAPNLVRAISAPYIPSNSQASTQAQAPSASSSSSSSSSSLSLQTPQPSSASGSSSPQLIIDIDRLDYPLHPSQRSLSSSSSSSTRKGASHPHSIYSQGFFFSITPSGQTLMGDAETLIKTQERPEDESKGRRLPGFMYDAARGVSVPARKKNGGSWADFGMESEREREREKERDPLDTPVPAPGSWWSKIQSRADPTSHSTPAPYREDTRPTTSKMIQDLRNGQPASLAENVMHSFYSPLGLAPAPAVAAGKGKGKGSGAAIWEISDSDSDSDSEEDRGTGTRPRIRAVGMKSGSGLKDTKGTGMIFFRANPPGINTSSSSKTLSLVSGTPQKPAEQRVQAAKKSKILFTASAGTKTGETGGGGGGTTSGPGPNIASGLVERYQKPKGTSTSQGSSQPVESLPRNPFRMVKR